MKSRFRHETNSPLLAALILSALLSNTAPLRAINPPAFAFSIDSSAVPGGFNNPQHLAVDTAGNLYVTDTGSNRVLRLSSSGAYLAQWGSPGTNAGQFSSPLGIAIDANNNVWVADKGNARVQKFSTNGNYSGSVALTLFGSPPVSGVAVDSANNLYAAYGNGSSTGLVVRFTSAGVSNAAYSANTIIYPEDVCRQQRLCGRHPQALDQLHL